MWKCFETVFGNKLPLQSHPSQSPKAGSLTSICTVYARRFYAPEVKTEQRTPECRRLHLQYTLIRLQQIIQAIFCICTANCTFLLSWLPLLGSVLGLKVTAMKVSINLTPKSNDSQAVIFSSSWAEGRHSHSTNHQLLRSESKNIPPVFSIETEMSLWHSNHTHRWEPIQYPTGMREEGQTQS